MLITSLAPAFEKAEIAARNMNNEMQKMEYYEGLVQGATTQVNIYDEQLKLLQQSLDLNIQSVYKQGEELGITRSRMEELVNATADGTFNTDMLTDSEMALANSLTDLMQKQEHAQEVSDKLAEAQKKLLKAQTDLSIAQDIEAGNFELAAARIEVAEAQGVYATEEATAKRIQLYKTAGKEERINLLQNLTPKQRELMLEYNAVTDKELANLAEIWRNSSDSVKRALLDGVGSDTQSKFEQEMNEIDNIIKSHQSFWQGVGDTLKEIFTFGQADTWTYNGEVKATAELKKRGAQGYATGTNYVPSTGLAYLHQGEAVIPAKYNKPYEPYTGNTEQIGELINAVRDMKYAIEQGIPVHGEFTQRGSDLVAAVERASSQMSNTILNKRQFAR